MTVRHPLTDRDASPAAVTVGSTTYPVDEDGVIDCPPEDERDVADVLSDAYDVGAEALLDDDGDGDDLAGKTSAELYEMAQAREISGRSEMDKADLIDALREHED